MKKIAIVTRILPSWRIELFKQIQTQFCEKKFEVLFFYDPNAKVIGEHISSGIPDGLNVKPLKIKSLNRLEYLSSLGKELRIFKPDIIIIEGSLNFINNLVLLFKNRFSVKSQLWGWSSGYFVKYGRFRNFIRRIIFSSYNGIFLYHSTALKIFRKEINYNGTLKVIGNSPGNDQVDKDLKKLSESDIKRIRDIHYKVNSNEIVVLFVGKLTKAKKVINLLKAANLLKNYNYKFIIIGDGPEYDPLIKIKEKNNLNNVIFLGRITNGINTYFQAADLFLLPGTGGMALIQALYNSLPIISSFADGIGPDAVIHQYNGLISENLDEYKIKLFLLSLSLPEARSQMSKNSFTQGKKFRTEEIVRKMVDSIL